MGREKWVFTCICWSCFRIFDVPAGLFLQGDPVCSCGSFRVSANHASRVLMDDLTTWFIHEHPEPFTSPDGRVVTQWTKEVGAIFASAPIENA